MNKLSLFSSLTILSFNCHRCHTERTSAFCHIKEVFLQLNLQFTSHCRHIEGYFMSAVKFSLTLKRKYSYYLLTMVLPVIFLALLGAFVFMLPVECGEKIGFGLTILLSLSVVMTIVSDNIPPVSSSTCILSKYF